MTEKTDNTAQLVTTDININKDDVAAIVVARAETMIKNQITEHQRIDKMLKAELKTLRAAHDKAVADTAADLSKATAEALQSAAKALGCVDVICKTDPPAAGSNEIVWSIRVVGSSPGIEWKARKSVAMPDALKANLAAIAAKNTAIDDNNTIWLDQRRKLQDLPSMERRAKAAVAEDRLSKSTEGQEILAMLEGRLDDSIKLLGVN